MFRDGPPPSLPCTFVTVAIAIFACYKRKTAQARCGMICFSATQQNQYLGAVFGFGALAVIFTCMIIAAPCVDDELRPYVPSYLRGMEDCMPEKAPFRSVFTMDPDYQQQVNERNAQQAADLEARRQMECARVNREAALQSLRDQRRVSLTRDYDDAGEAKNRCMLVYGWAAMLMATIPGMYYTFPF